MKLAYEAQSCPRAIVSLVGETLIKVSWGTNHIVVEIQMVLFTRRALAVLEGSYTGSIRMSGSLIMLMSFKSTLFLPLDVVISTSSLNFLALQVEGSCIRGENKEHW
jgi:hypothetical protein